MNIINIQKESGKRHGLQAFLLLVAFLIGGRGPHFNTALARTGDDASKPIEITEVRWPGMPTVVRSVRTTDDGEWVKNLTIEIENVTKKPIVGVNYSVYYPDPRGISNAMSLEWGHLDTGVSLPSSKEMTLLPGKRLTLTVPAESAAALLTHENLTGSYAREAEITFQCANFGDGRCLTNDPDSLEQGDGATRHRVTIEYIEPKRDAAVVTE